MCKKTYSRNTNDVLERGARNRLTPLYKPIRRGRNRLILFYKPIRRRRNRLTPFYEPIKEREIGSPYSTTQ